MVTLSVELGRSYDTLLRQERIAIEDRAYYKKWLCYYWDF